ncbi:MAG: hypothetical protein KY457_07290 [Actinobacteria bacterium]|nr:hypothetical protein [Actinomycetota bacterium]
MRRALLVATIAACLVPLAPSAGVAVPPETPAGDACRDATAGAVPEDARVRLCASIDAGANAATAWCREAAGLPAEECATPSGRMVDRALVDAYQGTWQHRAHALQRELGDPLPLRRTTMLATHNSYNAAAYPPTLSGSDPNQQYTITDQLRMDVRVLELDVHWWVSPEDGGRAPVLCHATGPHVGCSTDRHLREGLSEIADWLALPDNAGEVLIVRLENHLDDEEAHDTAAADLEDVLGPYLHRPPTDAPCRDFPLELTRDDIRAAGANILLVSDCGQGSAWPALVHAYGDRVEAGTTDFTSYPDCGTHFTREEHDAKYIRRFEDGTWLSTMAADPGPRIDATMAAEMLKCGVNQPSFDHLTPDDPRLTSTVWSWAEAEPAADTDGCAVHGADARFRAADCTGASVATHAACRTAEGWVLRRAGGLFAAARVCAAAGGTLGVPRTSEQNEALREAKAAAGVETAWLGYVEVAGDWTPEPDLHLPGA